MHSFHALERDYNDIHDMLQGTITVAHCRTHGHIEVYPERTPQGVRFQHALQGVIPFSKAVMACFPEMATVVDKLYVPYYS